MQQSSLRFSIQKKYFIKLENKILNALEFNMAYISPLPFLERFQRVLDIDRLDNPQNRQIDSLARSLCLQTMRTASFLEYRPSTIAAACLLLSIKLSSSKSKLPIKHQSLRQLTVQAGSRSARNLGAVDYPMSLWTDKIERLTGLS